VDERDQGNKKHSRAEVAELRSRGIKVEEYDLPGLKTGGVADIGAAWAAFIVDPGKNALGILQIKESKQPKCLCDQR
jgi:hypothetical protein